MPKGNTRSGVQYGTRVSLPCIRCLVLVSCEEFCRMICAVIRNKAGTLCSGEEYAIFSDRFRVIKSDIYGRSDGKKC